MAITRVATIRPNGWKTVGAIPVPAVLDAISGPGTVLLRGFEIEPEEFEAFTRRFSDRFYSPSARSSLLEHRGDELTTRAPEINFTLLSHNEGSYQPFDVPDLAFFLCLEPPTTTGGETTLVDGRLFLELMPNDLRQRFERQGVIYESLWQSERWKSDLGVDHERDLPELEKRHPGLECRMEGDRLRYRYRRSVIQEDNQGTTVFASAMLAHLSHVSHPAYESLHPYSTPDNRVYFGDGEEIPDEVINTLIDIQDQVAYHHSLARYDLLVIDNSRVMHGRRPTDGDCRRLLLTRFGYLLPRLRPGYGLASAS